MQKEGPKSGIKVRDVVITNGDHGKWEPMSTSLPSGEPDELVAKIEAMVDEYVKPHRSEDPDCITRLVTNEFSLYTTYPLTLEQFTYIQEGIAQFAKELPNVHLILGSFAVMSEGGELMNVVAHVQGGPSPQFD